MSGDTPKTTVHVETYGCQMNVLDSQLVRDRLEDLGYEVVDDPDRAAVVMLNTCSVRDLAEHKIWSRLGRLAAQKRDARLIVGVIGCMAEREHKAIQRRMPHVVRKSDRLRQVFVEEQGPRDVARDRRNLDRVREAVSKMVAASAQKHLRLGLQPTKRARVDHSIAIPLERASGWAFLFRVKPAPTVFFTAGIGF